MAPRPTTKGPKEYTGPTPLARLARLGTMGYELVAAIVVTGAIGWGVDWLAGSRPIGIITGAVLGILGGLYRFVRDARRALREGDGSSLGKKG